MRDRLKLAEDKIDVIKRMIKEKINKIKSKRNSDRNEGKGMAYPLQEAWNPPKERDIVEYVE